MKKNNKQKKVKNTKKGKIATIIIRTFSFIVLIASIVLLILFLKNINDLNMLPMKYFKIGALVLIGIELLFALICINKKKGGALLIILDIIMIAIMVVQWFGISYIGKTQKFLKDNLMKDYDVDEYYVVTNIYSEIKDIKEADGGKIYYYVDTDHLSKLKDALKKKTTAKIEKEESITDSLLKLYTPENLVILNSGTYQTLTANEDDSFGQNIKIIDTIKIYIKKDKKGGNKPNADITSKPFIIFLSGIDTRGKTLVKRSLSDVNMLIVVNPETKTILLVSIPRDSFVTLHGYGRKDKLTHAGSLGGLELSKSTVEDLMGVKADYYARVNFQAVINLVNTVGGVDVEEDPEITKRFSCWTDRGCWIEPGVNHLDGRCALAFARERYQYSKGDMQRNINQQKVLKALFSKMTSSPYIIIQYKSLLDAVDGTFETDMPIEDISALVQFQLNDMSAWTFESANVTGGTGREVTYSGGSTPLSVVYPSQKTINEAKDAIAKVIAGESLHPEEEQTTEE